jgi:CIC family chloride channel protein
VLVANTIAYLIARNLDPIPIFDRLSRQDGLELPSLEEEREAVIWRVEDAMRPLDVPVLRCAQLVAEATRALEHSQSGFALVEDDGEEWTTVSVAALEHAVKAGKADLPLSQVLAPERVAALFPDHPIATALSALATAAQVPVVHRADQHKVVGLIALQDVLALFRRLGEKAAGDGTKQQS